MQLALTCFPKQSEPVSEDIAVALQIYPYIALFSSLFLIATFIVYCILPEMRNNVHGMAVMCFVASLTSFYIGMAVIQLWYKEPIRWLCVGMGIRKYCL
jgi:4-amino-4-deoxy-L-arabinose transferase-like glycosyltransferase